MLIEFEDWRFYVVSPKRYDLEGEYDGEFTSVCVFTIRRSWCADSSPASRLLSGFLSVSNACQHLQQSSGRWWLVVGVFVDSGLTRKSSEVLLHGSQRARQEQSQLAQTLFNIEIYHVHITSAT